MSLMIETMESRVMLTASAGVIVSDLSAGTVALKTAKASLKAAVKEAALDIKGFKADIKGVKLTAPQKAALITLEKAEAIDAARLNLTVTRILAAGTVRGLQLESALKSLVAHPTKASVQLRVATALTKLQSVFSTTVIGAVQTVVSGDLAALDTDLAAVATAIPSTQTTVSTTTTDLSVDLTTFATDTTAIENAISALATDLA